MLCILFNYELRMFILLATFHVNYALFHSSYCWDMHGAGLKYNMFITLRRWRALKRGLQCL